MTGYAPTARRGLTVGIAIVLLSVGAFTRPGSAQTPPRAKAKKDVLVLSNGDRLTGEIKSLSRGKLSFDMDSTGIVSLKWSRVVSVTTPNLFEVETATGERLLGTLAPAGTGKLTVTEAGVAAREFEIQAIVGLAPIKQSFFSRLDGAIDLGGSYTQSSGIAQVYVDYWTTTRHPSFELRATFEDYVTFQREGATSEQLNGNLTYAHYLPGRWAVFGVGQVERNPDLGFSLRGTLGGGLEWTVLQSNRSELGVGAGIGASREKPVEGDTEVQIPLLLAFRYSLFIYDSPKTTLDTKFTAYPILNQSGRWRLRTDASIKRELFKDFSIGFTIYESFDSRPSSADAKRNDVGTTLTIGYTF